jgi:arylsulfatase A-like enzyme
MPRLTSLALACLAACTRPPAGAPSLPPVAARPGSVEAPAPATFAPEDPGPSWDGPTDIIVVQTDDQDLATLGDLPAIDRLLVQPGTTFDRFYATTPICAPSRATFLRGQYAHNHGVQWNTNVGGHEGHGGFAGFHGLGLDQDNLATWLQDAGYRTAFVGKYENDYPEPLDETYIPPGWDGWHALMGEEYLEGYGYQLSDNGVLREYGTDDDDYVGDVLAAFALDEIRRAAADGVPLFLMVSTVAPHAPSVPAPRHEGLFAGVAAPWTPAFDEADVSDKPSWMQAIEPFDDATVAGLVEQWRARQESLLGVDELVQDLHDALDEAGRWEGATVVYLSDNGKLQGEHRLTDVEGKVVPYEEAIHLPLVIKGPGFAAGAVLDPLVGMIDLAPTLAGIGGAAVPDYVDGRSILPLLEGDAPWRVDLGIESFAWLEQGFQPYFGVRHRDGVADEVYAVYDRGTTEAYDLTVDPHQLDNAVSSLDPARLARLAAATTALQTCAAATCRIADGGR